MEPRMEKQKWRSCSSQPTPTIAKLLAPKPLILLAEPQEKNMSIHHLLDFTYVNPCPILASCCSWRY